MPDTIGTGPGFHNDAPRRDVNQAVDVTGGRSHARVCLSRARRAPPLIGLGGARAGALVEMNRRAFSTDFKIRKKIYLKIKLLQFGN